MYRSFVVLGALLTAIMFTDESAVADTARGIVFHDKNENGKHDADERGLPDVRVSNGETVVKTDSQGRYSIPVTDDTIVFVIKPRGWLPTVDALQLPRFYYVHKPAGSPRGLRFAGVAPTGPLPTSIDFPMTPNDEPDRYQVILFGDPQPRDQKEIDYIAHDIVESLVGHPAAFGVSLGDVMFDNLSLFDALNRVVARIGRPWFNVHGNHDMNFFATEDRYADETWERVYGPATYSFDWGPVHYVVLDNVNYHGPADRRYHGEFGQKQLDWLRADLEHVPQDQLVVLMMHIPLPKFFDSPAVYTKDRAAFLALLEGRRHTVSLSAHTHIQQNLFVGPEDGWAGSDPHHHLNAGTICGSWWSGAPDEFGIPHTTMRDGAPNGWSIMTVDGNRYSIEYFAAGRPADHQMAIYAPEVVKQADVSTTDVLVNVFAGSARSSVELRVDNGPWITMERTEIEDPYFAAAKAREKRINPLPWRKLPDDVVKSSHIWKSRLPGPLAPGVHALQVRTTDMYGHTYNDHRFMRVAK